MSESDDTRRQTLTSRVDPHTERVTCMYRKKTLNIIFYLLSVRYLLQELVMRVQKRTAQGKMCPTFLSTPVTIRCITTALTAPCLPPRSPRHHQRIITATPPSPHTAPPCHTLIITRYDITHSTPMPYPHHHQGGKTEKIIVLDL